MANTKESRIDEKFRCFMKNRDDDYFLGQSNTPECNHIKTVEQAPRRMQMTPVRSLTVEPGCLLPENFTGGNLQENVMILLKRWFSQANGLTLPTLTPMSRLTPLILSRNGTRTLEDGERWYHEDVNNKTSDLCIYFSRWSTFVLNRGIPATWWRDWLLMDGESG